MDSRIMTVTDITMGKIAAKRIIDRLKGKTFDVVSSHTGYECSPTAWEGMSLKSEEPVIEGTLFKIQLLPSRNLSFDVIDKTIVFFESERQIRIERRLGEKGHSLIRTILINTKELPAISEEVIDIPTILGIVEE